MGGSECMRRSVNVVGWQSMGESADADADGRRVNIYSGGASGCRGVTVRDTDTVKVH